VNPRVEKSANVKAAGGVGMLLLNSDPATDSAMTEFHSVPTIHLKLEHREAIRAYAGKPGQLPQLLNSAWKLGKLSARVNPQRLMIRAWE
jgi:hypothetical protein